MQSDSNAPIISLSDVRKQYDFTHGHRWGLFGPRRKETTKDGYVALRDISFEVHRGEDVGVTARTARARARCCRWWRASAADSGTVEVDGRVSALLELGAGFNPEFTGATTSI